MKPIKIILPVGLLLALGMIFVATFSRNSPDAPKFVPMQTQPQGPFGRVHYDWGAPVPFQNDTVWIFTTGMSRSNFHEYLFDLQKRRVVGELVKGGAVFCNSNQTKLLCIGKEAMDTSLREKTRDWLAKVSLGTIRTNGERTESYWVLDLRDNSAKQIGGFGQTLGYGSEWVPAPGFRYGYNIPENSERGASFYLCDLEKAMLRKMEAPGELHGWWDEKGILISPGNNQFDIFDVETQKIRTVFTPEMIDAACQKFGIKLRPPITQFTPVSNWNGSNYDIYFEVMDWGNRKKSVFKVDKVGPSLTLLTRDFQSGHLGRLNSAGTHYIYNGESAAPGPGGNGAVLMNNLTNDVETVLVPPDNSGQYALPRFYREGVIYFRNHELWQVDLNGSNNVRLFPQVEK